MIGKCMLCATLVVLAAHAAHAETGFLHRRVKIGSTAYRYVVYIPPEWTAEKKWPVILFLHGSIEKGKDGEAQSRVCVGSVAKRDAKLFPGIIVMPQRL